MLESACQYVLCVALLLVGPEAVRAQCGDAFLDTRTVVLEQESQLLSTVESATMRPDGSLAVATADPGVFLFDSEGTLLRQLGRSGRGPSEYQGPLTVRSTGDDIAVWDAGNRKLLLFSSAGAPLREWTRIGRAVTDFALRGDTLYAYSGGIDEDYVSIYNYDNQNAPAVELGSAPGEHLPLSLLDGSGTLSYDDDRELLLFASPAEPVVYTYDPNADRHGSLRIADPDFTTAAVSEYTSLEDISANTLEAAEQAFRSSRFYFLQSVGDRVLSILQHGELVYDRSVSEAQATGGTESTLDTGGVETYTRRLHVHLHTKDGNVLACESLSFSKDEIESDSPIVGPTPRGFLILTTQTKDDTIEYELTEYSVSRSTK